MAASKFEEYNTAYKSFLTRTEQKKNYLLTALATKYPSIVDNIATKNLLRYEEVKDKLFSLHGSGLLQQSNNRQSEKALVVKEKPQKVIKAAERSVKCFYCQKVGHRINE